MADDNPCVNGRWEDGICKCDTGYQLGFTDEVLYPKYCEHQKVTIIQAIPYVSSEEIVIYISIMLTICLTVWSVLSLCTVIYNVLEKLKWNRKIKLIEGELQEFTEEKRKYENHEIFNATLWDPPLTFNCITKY